MERKRPFSPSLPLGPECGLSFPRQPARVLLVEAAPPWWSSMSGVLCEALENLLILASRLDGPNRIPLLSLYAVSRQPECLMPFVPVRGNLLRLRSSVEELRSLPGEGCERVAATRAEQLTRGVLDSLQQFKQYQRHSSSADISCGVEVTLVSSQLGRSMVRLMERGLKGADLLSLQRLLLVDVCSPEDCVRDQEDSPSLEDPLQTEAEDAVMLGAEVDLQRVDNSVFALETVLKSWLHQQSGDREHLQLLLPNHRSSLVCLKCDMQERLVSPTLIALTPPMGGKTKTTRDITPGKLSANQSSTPQRLKAIRLLRADGLCQSMLYGLPLLLRPSSCNSLDWDEMERNQGLFQALCHSLRSQGCILLLQADFPPNAGDAGAAGATGAAGAAGLCSHYVLQPSPSASLLLKPVVSRELFLPCLGSMSTQDPPPQAQQAIQVCLGQLEEEYVFNPLELNSNLYSHLRSRGLLSQPRYPYRVQVQRNQAQPLEGSKSTGSRQPRQGRQSGTNTKVRATVAPLPHSSAPGPSPAQASRPALTLLSLATPPETRAPLLRVPQDEEYFLVI